jgi:serine/threonine protein kinase
MSSDWPVASALMAGRYRLVSLLETGGMAEIWRAKDELLDRPVAVKLPTGPQVVWREARMAARLSHPGIAAVHDYREAVRPDGTIVPFVVMELLTGESVAARVDRELIGWAETARIGAAVADALAAAHASGVVHRDIKPGNVMLTPNGVKILDFGISVAAGEPDDDDTGATFGTPAYVAPERLDGMPAEPATDVYGVGVLLFEMVTGDPPYPVETWEELATARAPGPSELPESLPADFRAVVNRCLDADPAARPTAARLRADLLAVALRSRPPAPEAAPETPAAENGDGRDSSGENSLPAPRAPASGPIGNLVRAAGGSAIQLAAGGSASQSAAGSSGGQSGPSSSGGQSGPGGSASQLGASGSANQLAGGGSAGQLGAGSSANRSAAGSVNESAVNGGPAAGPLGAGAGPSGRAGADGVAGGAGRGWVESGPDAPEGGRFAGAGRGGSFDGGEARERSHDRSGPAAGSDPGFGAGDGVPYWRPGEQGVGGGSRPPSGPPGARRPAGTRNFATGRASAATLDMVGSPRRRTAFGIGAAVVLAALAGGFAVLTWTHPDGDRDVAVPPPATATVAPSGTPVTPAPAVTTTSPASVNASPRASLTFADAVSRMRDAVQGGEASGQIRQDVAQDLLNLLGPLSNAQGSDLTGQVQALRQKIRTRVGEGGVTEARAAVLQSRLEDLDRAAGT